MKNSTVLKLSAVVYLLFGVPLLLVPTVVMQAYRVQTPPTGAGLYNTMLLGGTLIAFGVMNWAASTRGLEAARTALFGTCVANALGLLITLWRLYSDPNALATGWVNVGVFLVFAVLTGVQLMREMAQTRLPRAAA